MKVRIDQEFDNLTTPPLKRELLFSWSIGSRMAEIQFMCPDRLELIGCIRGAGQKDEKALHRKFSHLRLHGEWFEPARELLNFIATEAHHAT